MNGFSVAWKTDSILHTVELLSKLETMFSKLATALSTRVMYYSKVLCYHYNIFTASSPGIDSISRNYFFVHP